MKQLFIIPLFSLSCIDSKEDTSTNNQSGWDFMTDGAAAWKGEAIWHRSIEGIVEEGFLTGSRTFFVQQYHDQEGTLWIKYWQNIPDRWGGGHCLFEGPIIPSESQLSFDISGSHCLWIDDTPGGEGLQAEERWIAKEGSLLIATELPGAESATDWQNYYAWSVRAQFATTWHQFDPDTDDPGLVKYGGATVNQDGYFHERDIDFGNPQLNETSCPKLEECWVGYLDPTILASDDDPTCEAARDWLVSEGHDYVSYTILNEGKEVYKPDTSQTIQSARRFDTCTTTFKDGHWLVRVDEGNDTIHLSRDGADHFQNINVNNLVWCEFRFEGELSSCD